MDGRQIEDPTSVEELLGEPSMELPNGLKLQKVEDLGKKWNSDWESASAEFMNNLEENLIIYKEFEKKAKKKVTTKVPEIWSQIQTELPLLVNSLFSRSEIVKPNAKYVDNLGNSIKMKLYVNSALLAASNARYKITDTIQNFLVFGTAVTKSYWDLSSEYEYDDTTSEWLEAINGKPNFQNISLFDFAVDPTYKGHDPNQAPWLRHRVYYTKEELMRMKQDGEIENFEDHELDTSKNMMNSKSKMEFKGDKDKNKDKIYVDEFWATLYWEEETDILDEFGEPTGETEKLHQKEEFFFWLLNNKKVIKFKRNRFKFKPFQVTRCYRVSDEFFGQGEVDIMKAYVEQMSDIHAKGGVLAKKVGGKLTFYTPASGFNKTDAKQMTDGLCMVDDLNQIRSENTTAGQDLQVLLNYKNSVKQDIESATGINSIIQGEPVGDQTATEASILNQASMGRLTIKLQNLQDEIIVPLASAYFKMSKQFIEEFNFSYKGEAVELLPQDFEGDYDWVGVGSVSQSNRALQIKQKADLAMQLTQVAMQAQQVKAAGFDLMGFVQNEILPLFEIPDASKYFTQPIPPEMPQGPEIMANMPDGMAGGQGGITQMSETIPQASDIEANASNILM